MFVDIAETKVGRPSQPKSLLLRSENRVLAGIFDGSGCWGYGPDAASRVLKDVRARWEGHLGRLTPEELAEDLNAASRALPAELREEDPCAFSVLLALAEGDAVSVVGAGVLSGLVLPSEPGAPARWHARPRMLVDDLVARGQLAAAEAPTFPHRNVCVGPFLGGEAVVAFSTSAERLASGERLVLGHHQLLTALEAMPPAPGASAAELQARSPREHPATVVVMAGRASPPR